MLVKQAVDTDYFDIEKKNHEKRNHKSNRLCDFICTVCYDNQYHYESRKQ